MDQNRTNRVTSGENAAQRAFAALRNDRWEEDGCKCAFPSCKDKAWRDHLCWDHYREENYTGR